MVVRSFPGQTLATVSQSEASVALLALADQPEQMIEFKYAGPAVKR